MSIEDLRVLLEGQDDLKHGAEIFAKLDAVEDELEDAKAASNEEAQERLDELAGALADLVNDLDQARPNSHPLTRLRMQLRLLGHWVEFRVD